MRVHEASDSPTSLDIELIFDLPGRVSSEQQSVRNDHQIDTCDSVSPNHISRLTLQPLVVRCAADGRLAPSLSTTDSFAQQAALVSIRAHGRALDMNCVERAYQTNLACRVHMCASKFRTNQQAMKSWKITQVHGIVPRGEILSRAWRKSVS